LGSLIHSNLEARSVEEESGIAKEIREKLESTDVCGVSYEVRSDCLCCLLYLS
jgi:hypothetical protein